MTSALKALLRGAIDYAGLFPPAELSLDESIRNYARFHNEAENWMLGRFICPAARLKELAPYLHELFHSDQLLEVSALGRGGEGPEEFVTGFGRDMQSIVEFQQEHGSRVHVRVLETRLPAGAGIGFDFDSKRIALFLEPPVSGDRHNSIVSAANVACSAARGCGLKLRLGGADPSAFPPSELVAFAIVHCRENRLPLKFTAGLHHPIRRPDPSLDARTHGFVNVFAAGVFAHVGGLTESRLVPILDDEDPRDFVFDEDGLRWRDCTATTQQIASVRQHHIISFGSCSFDEPRDDLRALGWL